MGYLSSQVAARSDLRTAFPWARSVLCVGLQYDTPHAYSTEAPAGRGWIARYAWGDDYHDVMKAMLERLRDRLVAEAGPFESRAYVDTGPIAEKAWAAAAGLGALGKNTCLLHPEHGSWFFLGELVTDLDVTAGRAARGHVRQLHRLPRRLPDAGVPGALRARRHALHQLPDDRAEGRDSIGAARRHGPSRVRLRHLPGRVPVEPQAAAARRRELRAAAGRRRPRPRRARRPRRSRRSASGSAAVRSSAPSGAACCATSPSRSRTRAMPATGGGSSSWPVMRTRSWPSTRAGRSQRLDARLSAAAGSSGA